jgi:hypothetical protein
MLFYFMMPLYIDSHSFVEYKYRAINVLIKNAIVSGDRSGMHANHRPSGISIQKMFQ